MSLDLEANAAHASALIRRIEFHPYSGEKPCPTACLPAIFRGFVV